MPLNRAQRTIDHAPEGGSACNHRKDNGLCAPARPLSGCNPAFAPLDGLPTQGIMQGSRKCSIARLMTALAVVSGAIPKLEL